MAKQTREQLGVQDGQTIVIKGSVQFARIDKPISGSALQEENEKRQRLGMIKADKEFRQITVENPEIVSGGDTPLAQFHGQEVYNNKSGKPAISFESKSKFPPVYGHIQNGVIQEIEDPERNPAPGQIVYLMIRSFSVKNYNNLGSTFNAIVYEEGPIEFFEGGGNSLEGFGEAMNMPVQKLEQEQPKNVDDNSNAGAAQQPNTGNGFGAPPQNNGFGAPPQNNGFGSPQQPQNNGFGMQDNEAAKAGQQGGNPFAGSNSNVDNPFSSGDHPFA